MLKAKVLSDAELIAILIGSVRANQWGDKATN
jgi:hypothetical protein